MTKMKRQTRLNFDKDPPLEASVAATVAPAPLPAVPRHAALGAASIGAQANTTLPHSSPPATQSPIAARRPDTRESGPFSSSRLSPPTSLSANSARNSEQSSRKPALVSDVP